MQVEIEKITINERIRKDLGDLSPLVESLKIYGLMEPILLDKHLNLIAGHRRLESAKLLGWSTIEASIKGKLGDVDKLKLEIEENVQRKSFTEEELTDAYLKLDRLIHPNLFRRIWLAILGFFRKIANLFRKH